MYIHGTKGRWLTDVNFQIKSCPKLIFYQIYISCSAFTVTSNHPFTHAHQHKIQHIHSRTYTHKHKTHIQHTTHTHSTHTVPTRALSYYSDLTRRNPFNQLHRSFQRKLCTHWLKFLRQQYVSRRDDGLCIETGPRSTLPTHKLHYHCSHVPALGYWKRVTLAFRVIERRVQFTEVFAVIHVK